MWEKYVFPTHVGVFPRDALKGQDTISLPHARGGVSITIRRAADDRKSSPRTWGCFCSLLHLFRAVMVFPTHVGVFLIPEEAGLRASSLPHARGGVSNEGEELP